MKLYFVRHGESEANIVHEFSNRGLKHPLTERGKRQAEVLADSLSVIRFEKIYSSPLLRARQTSAILAERFALEVELTRALSEWDVGVLEGRRDPESWELYGKLCHTWIDDGIYDARMEGGESFLDQLARFQPFIDNLINQYGSTESAFLLVGHGGLFRCMLPFLSKNLPFSFSEKISIANTSYILLENRGTDLYCLEWCGQKPIHPT